MLETNEYSNRSENLARTDADKGGYASVVVVTIADNVEELEGMGLTNCVSRSRGSEAC